MFPTAKDCGFLSARKPFLTYPPAHTMPSGDRDGKRTVSYKAQQVFLALTKQGWFALFALDAHQTSLPIAVVLRKDGVDTLFESAEALEAFLQTPVIPGPPADWYEVAQERYRPFSTN